MYAFSRNLLTFGKRGQAILEGSSVLVLGLGGVGSYAVEALARSGIGRLIIIDYDTVDITNINRQLHATVHTVGKRKSDLMKARILDINPECEVVDLPMKLDHETVDGILSERIDFVVDCSDTITYKILLIEECLKRKLPFISVMGAANKTDPTQLEIDDIRNTSYDPIAKVMRIKLKKLGVKGKIPVVYSKERPLIAKFDELQLSDDPVRKKCMPPASNSFVPPVAGFIAASYAIRELTKEIEIKRIGDE